MILGFQPLLQEFPWLQPYLPCLRPRPEINYISADLITSMLCSITITVLPLSTSFWSILMSLWTSAKCSPVVGSSSIYIVLPVLFLLNSAASLILCASPPDNVVEGWPSLIYERPTSYRVCSLRLIASMFSKNFRLPPPSFPKHRIYSYLCILLREFPCCSVSRCILHTERIHLEENAFQP